MSDNFLQRGVQGWTDWVREIVSFGQYGRTPQAKTVGRIRPAASPGLKTSLKPSNKAQLRRDLKEHRRPAPKEEKAQEMVQLRRRNPVIKDFKKKPVTAEEKLVRRVDPPRPFDIDEEYLETPKERRDRVERIPKKKALNPFSQPPMSKLRRHLLYLNPGTQKVLDAHRAFAKGTEMPKWTQHLMLGLTYDSKNLYFENLPLATKEQKRMAVKDIYFNPEGPSTIQPIVDVLYPQFANISRINVRRILRSLETYQVNFGRRLPPKVLSRMSMVKPGVILTDMFFPSTKHGWRKFGGVVTMMDAWSRFVGAYAVERKTKGLVKKAMERFMRDFTSHGHRR